MSTLVKIIRVISNLRRGRFVLAKTTWQCHLFSSYQSGEGFGFSLFHGKVFFRHMLTAILLTQLSCFWLSAWYPENLTTLSVLHMDILYIYTVDNIQRLLRDGCFIYERIGKVRKNCFFLLHAPLCVVYWYRNVPVHCWLPVPVGHRMKLSMWKEFIWFAKFRLKYGLHISERVC
jgi:hypothetical protein